MKLFLLFIMLMIPLESFSQRVRLNNIPGQDSDMNIPDMLDQIMAPYYDEITNLNNKRTDEEIKNELWQEFRSNVQNFERINKYIMGYDSSFRSLTNEVSDPSALSVQTTRAAKNGSYRININTLATAHAFSSAPISLSQTIPSGRFYIIVDNKTNLIPFDGGNVENLFNAIRTYASDEVDVKLLNASDNEKIIALVSKVDGTKGKITFDGDLNPLIESKILTRGQEINTNFSWRNNTTNIIITNSSAVIPASYKIDMPTVLKFKAVLSDIPIVEKDEEKSALSNLNVTELGAVSSYNISLPGAAPILYDLDEEVEEIKTPVQEFAILFNDNSKEIISLTTDEYFMDLSPFIGKTIIDMAAVAEDKILNISDIHLTASPDGALALYNESSKAQNAVFTLDGVELTRPSNSVSDVIDGVTLNLLQEHKNNVLVKITPDKELVMDTIVQWIVNYNEIMEEIYTFTTVPMDRIGRLKPLHEREAAGEDLKEGTFYGNASLISFKDRLRRLVGNMYGRNAQNEISLLDQIGIYVRRYNSFNNDPDAIRKGTLNLEVSELSAALDEHFESVKDLFVHDTDGDNVGDDGLAPQSLQALDMMIGNGGYITKLMQDAPRKIRDMETQISKKEDEIDRVSRREHQALLQMSQAVAESKALSESLKQRMGF